MAVWAIADLHLSFGVPDKSMEFFGEEWKNFTVRIYENWQRLVAPQDLVLIAGDISWAMRLEEVIPDLEWIDKLPGTKVFIKGNHDYWWTSLSKVEKILPPSIHLIQNDVFRFDSVAVAGARLWDTPEYDFGSFIEKKENPKAKVSAKTKDSKEDEKVFARELGRLEMSLKCFRPEDALRIAMTHYPPIGKEMENSKASLLLEKYHVDICVFGHLHNLKPNVSFEESKNGVSYYLTAADYLKFIPRKIVE